MVGETVKSLLIEAAGKAFGESGYDAVGVRDICRAAKVNVAAINYYFGDKRGLYVACLRHAQSCRVEDIASGRWPAEFTPIDKLRGFIRAMLESKLDSTRPAWHLEMMLREMARPTDACREIVEDYIRPMAEALAEILRELLPGAQRNQQTWMIGFSIVAQVLFYHVNQPVIRLLMGEESYGSLSLDGLTDHITQFSLAAIGLAPSVLGPAGDTSTIASEIR